MTEDKSKPSTRPKLPPKQNHLKTKAQIGNVSAGDRGSIGVSARGLNAEIKSGDLSIKDDAQLDIEAHGRAKVEMKNINGGKDSKTRISSTSRTMPQPKPRVPVASKPQQNGGKLIPSHPQLLVHQ